MLQIGQKVRIAKINKRPEDHDETIDALRFYIGCTFTVTGITSDGELHMLDNLSLEFYEDELEVVE